MEVLGIKIVVLMDVLGFEKLMRLILCKQNIENLGFPGKGVVGFT